MRRGWGQGFCSTRKAYDKNLKRVVSWSSKQQMFVQKFKEGKVPEEIRTYCFGRIKAPKLLFLAA